MVLAVDSFSTEPMVIRPIAVPRDKRDAPSKEFVEDVLGQIDVSICKRLQSSDASVSRVYSPDCETLRWKEGLPPYCRCSSCVWQLLQSLSPRSIQVYSEASSVAAIVLP